MQQSYLILSVTEKLDAIDVAHIAAEVQGLGTYELQTYKSDKMM